MSHTDDIKAEAENLGFFLSGVGEPGKPAHFPQFENWLGSGRQGSMDYLARPESLAKRGNPGLVFAGVRSILSLGVLYSSPLNQPGERQSAEIRGRVAAYAWGEDYHAVLPPRLDRLAHKGEAILGKRVQQRRYTDTGPILERDLAMSAGMGWIGKNTCLISPSSGSFFFLAELLLDVELEPDPPFPYDRCGSCRRCIDACPTACILPDRTIDATRCISYLTIENKGTIPTELRPQMGNWVFGCDVCQEVCPWNLRFAPPAGDPAFAPRPNIPHPVLQNELKLDSPAFNQKFKDSPILRARRRGYLRNVCMALGNQPDSGNIPALADVLENEPEPLIRSHAAWALGRIATQVARKTLEIRLLVETEPIVRMEIQQALNREI